MCFARILATLAGGGANEVVLSGFKTVAGAVVQFLTTIGTANETGEHIGLARSGRSAFVLAKFFHTGKGFLVNNGFMGVLENLPLIGRVFEFLFALIRLLTGFEVDHVTKVFLLFQYACNGTWCPIIRIIWCLSRGISSHFHPMNGRTIHLCFLQLLGNLRGIESLHTPCEDLTDNGCGFIIHNPMSLWIVGVFHVAIGRVGSQILTGFTFLFHNRLNLFTAVLDIELVDDIQERRKIVVLLIGTVHTAVHSDEADIVFREKHFRVETDFQIVSADTAHILGDDDTNLIVLNQLNHSFPIGSVEVSPGVAIVYEKLDISETLFLCVFFENRLLIYNAVAIACQFVVTT